MTTATDPARLERLRSVPLFADLAPESLTRVAEITSDFTCPTGQVLVAPNQVGAGLFVIEEGKVMVEVRDRKFELGRAEVIGELALLDENATHSGRVRATTEVRGFAIARDDFSQALQDEPKIALTMLKTLARRLARAAPL